MMNRPRLVRVLRIACTALCGIACVLLVVVWVVSRGTLAFVCYTTTPGSSAYSGSMHFHLLPPTFDVTPRLGKVLFRIPIWLTVLVTAILASAPWRWTVERRFSLRTLLIATTLVAVGLGLIVWMTR